MDAHESVAEPFALRDQQLETGCTRTGLAVSRSPDHEGHRPSEVERLGQRERVERARIGRPRAHDLDPARVVEGRGLESRHRRTGEGRRDITRIEDLEHRSVAVVAGESQRVHLGLGDVEANLVVGGLDPLRPLGRHDVADRVVVEVEDESLDGVGSVVRERSVDDQ